MAFRDELRPASFRGAAFVAGSFGRDGGRRLALHSYPGVDEHYPEDMGRGVRRLPLTAWLLEPDALGKARQLVEALEQPGPGRLVHPAWGEITCAVESFSHGHAAADGSRIAIDITFVEAHEARYPAQGSVSAGRVDAAAITAQAATTEGFLSRFRISALKDQFAQAAADALGVEAMGLVREVSGAAMAVSSYAREIQAIATEALAMVYTPAAIPGRVLSLFGAGGVSMGLSGLLSLAGFVPRLSAFEGTSTPNRRDTTTNRAAIGTLVRQGAAIEAARQAPTTAFASGRDALAARDAIAEVLDAEAGAATDLEFQALADLRAAVWQALTGIAPALPQVLTLTLVDTRPALAIAQDLFGDRPWAVAPGAAAIVARNRLRDPLFVPAGTAIEAEVPR